MIVMAGALLGLCAGSYLATLVLRWPRGEGTGGRSRCDGCGATLRWFELVPLASALAQRGSCRRCGARIDPTHLFVEIAGALVGIIAFALLPIAQATALGLAGWLLLALALLDWRHFWLPDRLVLPLAVAGLLASTVGPPLLVDRLVGGAAGFGALTLVAWVYARLRGRQGLGQGDPKLLGALGCWTGWQLLPLLLVGASLLGLLVVLVALLGGRRVEATTRLPFGTFLAASGWPLALLAAAPPPWLPLP